MTDQDELIHDLNDRLNGITLSAELAVRLLSGQGNRELKQILERIGEESNECARLLAELRKRDAS